MTIIVDSRQQAGKHEEKHKQMEELGAKLMVSKLPIGDYGRLDNLSTVVDTKKDVLELLQNINQDHARFKTECIKAMENGIKLIILIEEMPPNGDIRCWKSPTYKADGYKTVKGKKTRTHKKGEQISKASTVAANRTMWTMTQRYGVSFIFCEKEDTGRKILELLGY